MAYGCFLGTALALYSYPGGEYDASVKAYLSVARHRVEPLCLTAPVLYNSVGRRSGAAVDTPGPRAPSVSGSAPRTAAASARPSASAARKAPGAASTSRVAGAGAGAAAGAASAAAVQALTSQMSDMRVTVDGLEKEVCTLFSLAMLSSRGGRCAEVLHLANANAHTYTARLLLCQVKRHRDPHWRSS